MAQTTKASPQPKPYQASERQRKALLRATPVFWLLAALLLVFTCALAYGVSRSTFRASYNPHSVTAIAALLPTDVPSTATPQPTSRPPATSIPQYVWTVGMVPLTNGQYMVPKNVGGQIQAAWTDALSSLDALPWENVNLDAFTGSALETAKQAFANHGAPSTGPLTKTVAGKRVFAIVGCDASGGTCQVTEVFGQVSLDQYDFSSQQKVGSAALKGGLMYLFAGTMVYDGGRWKLSILQEPVTALPS